MTTKKTYRIVPAGTRDTYAAGEAANHFETRAEAEAAIASLRELGGEWDHDWDVLEERDATRFGRLCEYRTGRTLRAASEAERAASRAAARNDAGRGVILVDGASCYVEE